MQKLKNYLYPTHEAHVRITADGNTVQADGVPEWPGSHSLPDYYHSGLCAIFNLLESMLPSLSCISVMGIWQHGDYPSFYAIDLWAQTGQEGFYLPMASAASLFSQFGIPYYHQPLI